MTTPTPRPKPKPWQRQSRRRMIGVAALVGAVAILLVGASLVSRRLFEAPTAVHTPVRAGAPAPAPSAPLIQPASPGAAPFQVAEAEGKVEAFRDARWVAIKKGDKLTVQDVVRTGPGAHAVLRRGSSSELELREKVDVRLDRFTEDAARLDVLRGKVVANVARQGESLEITARETRSTNEGLARFVVAVDDKGKVAVASTSGTTRFSAQGKEVRLVEGTESHAEPGKPPAEPEKIPEEVLLSVIWPAGEKRDDRTQVRGQVRASASVHVNGVEADVSPDGRFVATVPLREGANRVEVEAEDLAGKTKTLSNVVRRHGKAPSLQAEPEELWQK